MGRPLTPSSKRYILSLYLSAVLPVRTAGDRPRNYGFFGKESSRESYRRLKYRGISVVFLSRGERRDKVEVGSSLGDTTNKND